MKNDKNNINRDNHEIDKLFRNALGDYEIKPSKNVWKGINATYLKNKFSGINFFKPNKLFIAFAIIGAGIIIYIFYPFSKTNSNIKISHNSEINQINTQNEIKPNLVLNQKESYITTPEPEPSVETTFVDNKSDNLSVNNNIVIQNETKKIVSVLDEKPSDDQKIIVQKNNSPAISGLQPLNLKSNLVSYHQSKTKNNLNFGLRNTYQPLPDVRLKDDYARKANLAFGIHFTPGIIIYQSKPNKYDYTFEISANYLFSKFILQSGIGVSLSGDNGGYEINYERYDSVGYYLNVVSFTVDPVNPDSIILTTKTENVYDSVEHYSISQATNRYTYLQIPLTLSYKIWDFKRISCYLKGGAIFSILLNKYEPEVNFSDSEAKIITIENQTFSRINTNWQFVAGVSFNYRLNNKLILSVEPTYKQYINSVYDKRFNPQAKRPYIIGLRTGLIFNL
ncbi:MAG: outer membrane beta-barrel protein [Bacteroidales bacterium]|nr:outer membrane beta-barrel protein [Bacteroidales bacterium]